MPPISCFGSAPLMIFSWPAASISAIQLRRSLLGTAMSPNSRVTGIGETGDDIVVHDAGIVGQDIGFGPTIGQQPITNSAESRVPRMTGLPARTSGSSAI